MRKRTMARRTRKRRRKEKEHKGGTNSTLHYLINSERGRRVKAKAPPHPPTHPPLPPPRLSKKGRENKQYVNNCRNKNNHIYYFYSSQSCSDRLKKAKFHKYIRILFFDFFQCYHSRFSHCI